MFYILNIIEFISACILFTLCIISYKKIRTQEKELIKVYKELDEVKQLNEKLKMERDYDENKIKTKMIPILKKIQKNYNISKTDKACLIEYFSGLIYTFKYYNMLDILYTMNVGKKFTYKEATDNIINFINHKQEPNLQEVVESIFFLIIK